MSGFRASCPTTQSLLTTARPALEGPFNRSFALDAFGEALREALLREALLRELAAGAPGSY